MLYWEAILLGIIQGLTEFLPVSSSGHLVLGKVILGLEIDNIAFEIFVHFGTLLAVLTIFKKEILILLKAAGKVILLRASFSNLASREDEEAQGLRLLGFLVIGTLPASLIGFIFKDALEATFSSPFLVCVALIATGVILLASKLSPTENKPLSSGNALAIGLAQIAALFPGISRSGTTISAGMLCGLERVEAARFSFLLAIPLIFAATILQSVELASNLPAGKELLTLTVGTVMAYLSGLLAIKWLLLVVERDRFSRFAYYCFTVGIVGILILLIN